MESESLRNSLLAALSHDLRTPLAALLGLAESLSLTQPPLSQAQAKIAEAVGAQTRRLIALVNNLLDMARIQSGEVRLNKQWHLLEEVVGSALRGLEATLAAHPLRAELPPDLPLVEMDAVLIERVLANLLENAAKFTPPGTPIAISATAGDGKLEVSVADEGPGVPEGQEETIFEKFARGRQESSTPGVGLGLAICRAIVEAHGGTIRVQRVTPHGARFVFTLPAGTPPPVAPAA
jgi:two-component system sensor histidine kinase KdpD